MAVPTIVSVSPFEGPAGGRNLVVITGTNFRLPTDLPPTGPITEPLPPSVLVTFGGFTPRRTEVASATEIYVEMAAYQGEPRAHPIDPVDVVVSNIDDNGVVIPGETATEADAYTYLRPATLQPHATDDQQQFGWVHRQVLRIFRRQVHQNVFDANTSVDYADAGVEVVHDAPMPNVTILGPEVLPDPWRSTHHRSAAAGSEPGTWDNYYPPSTRILRYQIVAVSNNKGELRAIQQGIEELFQRNGYLFIDPLPSDPTQPREWLDFVLTGLPRFRPGTGLDLHEVSAAFEVRGVDLKFRDAHGRSSDVETFQLRVQQGVSRQEGDEPGMEGGAF